MADAQTPVLTDEQIDAAVEAWFANLDDGQPHSFRGRMRCAILAAQAPAHPTEAVGTLSIQRFRGHLENASFDYTGALPDGDYALYTHPAQQQENSDVQNIFEALYGFLASICPEGIADEAFRIVPDSLLPYSIRSTVVQANYEQGHTRGERMGSALEDRRTGGRADASVTIHPAPSQPDRAVMQQALDALRGMIDYFAPNGWGDAVPDIANARAAIAALEKSLAP